MHDTEPKLYQCRHIFTDGHRCGSPSLRNEEFCYYHHTSRRPAPRCPQDATPRGRRNSSFALRNPEDRSAIQHSIGQILNKLAANEIDPRRAGLLLYGLQIASLNLKKDPKKPNSDAAEPVSEIVQDPELGILAPEAELGSNEPKSTLQRLCEEMDELDRQRDEEAARRAIPSIHASAAHPARPNPPRVFILPRNKVSLMRAFTSSSSQPVPALRSAVASRDTHHRSRHQQDHR